MLWSIAFLLMELKAFFVSTKSTSLVPSCWNKSHTVWMTVIAPASWPAHTCKDPATFWTSFFVISTISFPVIRWISSSTPVGQFPRFLFGEKNDLQRMLPKYLQRCWLLYLNFWCKVFWWSSWTIFKFSKWFGDSDSSPVFSTKSWWATATGYF